MFGLAADWMTTTKRRPACQVGETQISEDRTVQNHEIKAHTRILTVTDIRLLETFSKGGVLEAVNI